MPNLMPRLDLTLNLWNLLGFAAAILMAAWRVGAWAEAMEALRRAFEAHVAEDDRRFERQDDRLAALHARLGREP